LPKDAPEYVLTIDSTPAFADAEEDEKVLKLKTTFERTWAVDVLVDLLRLENKRESVEHNLKACPFEALLCRRLRSELDDLNKVLHASDPTVTAVELKQIIHKLRTDTSLMLHKRRPRFSVPSVIPFDCQRF
jgi:hypothetical protein